MTETAKPRATVIVPASNEAGYIGPCLEALLGSDGDTPFETIIVANGCSDATVNVARDAARRMAHPQRPVRIIDIAGGGKPGALQLGDEAARAPIRIYLDADVIVSAHLVAALVAALAADAPRYASGTPVIATAKSPATRAYARFWQRLPFLGTGVPGFGLYAVNAAARARWGAWPQIISDDTFARLNFAPDERVMVPATYRWPMVEGLAGLIRVRRRQDRGVREIAERFPALEKNRDDMHAARGAISAVALRDPVGFAVYALVAVCVRLPLPGTGEGWARGR